ncbi:MAG: hypothetical protein ACLU4N_16990 [Butyricimonas faecihominis]
MMVYECPPDAYQLFCGEGITGSCCHVGDDLETAKAAAGEILEIADDIFPWVTTCCYFRNGR